MLAVVILQWMLSTVHVSLGFTVRIRLHLLHHHHCTTSSHFVPLQRLVFGFIYNRDEPGGPAAYFSNISIPSNVAKVFIHTLNVSSIGPIGYPPWSSPSTLMARPDRCWRWRGRLEVGDMDARYGSPNFKR